MFITVSMLSLFMQEASRSIASLIEQNKNLQVMLTDAKRQIDELKAEISQNNKKLYDRDYQAQRRAGQRAQQSGGDGDDDSTGAALSPVESEEEDRCPPGHRPVRMKYPWRKLRSHVRLAKDLMVITRSKAFKSRRCTCKFKMGSRGGSIMTACKSCVETLALSLDLGGGRNGRRVKTAARLLAMELRGKTGTGRNTGAIVKMVGTHAGFAVTGDISGRTSDRIIVEAKLWGQILVALHLIESDKLELCIDETVKFNGHRILGVAFRCLREDIEDGLPSDVREGLEEAELALRESTSAVVGMGSWQAELSRHAKRGVRASNRGEHRDTEGVPAERDNDEQSMNGGEACAPLHGEDQAEASGNRAGGGFNVPVVYLPGILLASKHSASQAAAIIHMVQECLDLARAVLPTPTSTGTGNGNARVFEGDARTILREKLVSVMSDHANDARAAGRIVVEEVGGDMTGVCVNGCVSHKLHNAFQTLHAVNPGNPVMRFWESIRSRHARFGYETSRQRYEGASSLGWCVGTLFSGRGPHAHWVQRYFDFLDTCVDPSVRAQYGLPEVNLERLRATLPRKPESARYGDLLEDTAGLLLNWDYILAFFLIKEKSTNVMVQRVCGMLGCGLTKMECVANTLMWCQLGAPAITTKAFGDRKEVFMVMGKVFVRFLEACQRDPGLLYR